MGLEPDGLEEGARPGVRGPRVEFDPRDAEPVGEVERGVQEASPVAAPTRRPVHADLVDVQDPLAVGVRRVRPLDQSGRDVADDLAPVHGDEDLHVRRGQQIREGRRRQRVRPGGAEHGWVCLVMLVLDLAVEARDRLVVGGDGLADRGWHGSGISWLGRRGGNCR